MCSHADCRVEELPDGSVDEYHEFTEEDMRRFGKSLKELQWKLDVIEKYGVIPKVVVFDGKSGTSS